ncbi:hypothetical protein HNP33_002531 [Comamonas odontotermitis]|uniref:Uncharacterized protein n=1 Tax=Comamonas odontotermitis TaxID=379895 RepID=A0ABR6RH29_9BURK|nr:hypothetical protein [Comamonas odontotermitis]
MPTNQKPSSNITSLPTSRQDGADLDYQLSNHQLRTAIMNTVNCLRPSLGIGSSMLPPETTNLLNQHLAELQAIERERARIVLSPTA